MAQAQLDLEAANALPAAIPHASKAKIVKKDKKRPIREVMKKEIAKATLKQVDSDGISHVHPDAKPQKQCGATGILFNAENEFHIPLKAVRGVTTSLELSEYVSKLPLVGSFISPVAAVYFLKCNPQIPNHEQLITNVIDYYSLDAAYTLSRCNTLLGLRSQPASSERTATFLHLVQPDEANLFNIKGCVTKKRARESSSKEPSAKRARTEKSSSSSASAVAQSIEDTLTQAV